MTNYRRNFVPGGSFFFAVNLAERRSLLLTDHVGLLRAAFGDTRARHPGSAWRRPPRPSVVLVAHERFQRNLQELGNFFLVREQRLGFLQPRRQATILVLEPLHVGIDRR